MREGRRNTSSKREGGVCLIMSVSVLFHLLEKQREKQRKPKGTGEETDLQGDARKAWVSGHLQK